MTTRDDDILDDLFHGCALQAYLEIWVQTQQFPPNQEATRRRAYQLYEEALAEKDGRPHRPALTTREAGAIVGEELASSPPQRLGVAGDGSRKAARPRNIMQSVTE
jgi:hypothetical protein